MTWTDGRTRGSDILGVSDDFVILSEIDLAVLRVAGNLYIAYRKRHPNMTFEENREIRRECVDEAYRLLGDVIDRQPDTIRKSGDKEDGNAG